VADYFPLLSRTIVSLGDSTPDQRATIYRRAREVLTAQLAKVEPPLGSAVVRAEMTAFDDAVLRVEREARRFDPPSQRTPEPDPAPRPAEPRPAAKAAEREEARKPIAAPPSAVMVPRKPSAPVIRDAEIPKPSAESGASLNSPSAVDPATPATASDDPISSDVRSVVASNAEAVAVEVSRPRIQRRSDGDLSWVRPIVLGFAIAAVVIGVGALAFILRDRPADFEKPVSSAGPEERKVVDRLPSDRPVDQPAASGADGRMSSGAALPVQVTQRAALFEEPLPGSSDARTTQGRVVWRLDTSEADVAVRASVEMAGAIDAIELRIRRNRDAKFPASHLVEFRFSTPETDGNGPVRDIGVPEMRQEENIRGTPLAGLPVPVTENVFLMGLTNLPQEIERNRDLLRTRNWILLPVRFANGRRAILLVEKGPTGDRVVADALQAWR
jgi:hypothetical protein